MTVLVGLLVATATVFGLPPARTIRQPRLPRPRALWIVTAGGVLTGAWWRLEAEQLVLVVIAFGVAAWVARFLLRARARRLAEARTDQVLLVAEAIADDLAAGQPPVAALRRAARDWPELASVAGAAELDADVPAALREVARLPGAGRLIAIAAAWQVAQRSGSGMALVLRRVAGTLRAERRAARLVGAELAAARATARMMAALPVLVMLLGAGIGGDPVGFLTGTPVGLGCLAAGLALAGTGLFWLERIADAVLEGR